MTIIILTPGNFEEIAFPCVSSIVHFSAISGSISLFRKPRGIEFWVLDFRFYFLDFKFWNLDFFTWILGFGIWDLGLFIIQGLLQPSYLYLQISLRV